jgi:hypothetical protein
MNIAKAPFYTTVYVEYIVYLAVIFFVYFGEDPGSVQSVT